jgi:hypothetical protein
MLRRRSREVPEAGMNKYVAKPVKIEDLEIACGY